MVVDHEVYPISGFQPDILKKDRQDELPGNQMASLFELMRKACLIGGLEQARTEGPVDDQTSVHHISPNRLNMGRNSLVSFVHPS